MESWISDYAVDHADINRQRELQRRTFHFQSPQLQFRSSLVTWVLAVSEDMKFCYNTVHLAVYILDIFMDNHQIDVDRLHFVALVSLSIAAKYEENDTCVPKINDLKRILHKRYSTKEFRDLEWMILRFLDWRLDLPTASHFVDYYSLFTVSQSDWDPLEYSSYEVFWKEAQQAVKEYLHLSLLDKRMLCYPPSMVACACILLSRQQLRLPVKWTEQLKSVTKYDIDDLLLCANNVLSKSTRSPALKRKLVESPDHGYSSGDGSNHSSPNTSAVTHQVKVRKRL